MIKRIELNLSEDDFESLKDKADLWNVSIKEIITNYIRDLVYSNESNGSDERDLANEYFSRSIVNYGEIKKRVSYEQKK